MEDALFVPTATMANLIAGEYPVLLSLPYIPGVVHGPPAKDGECTSSPRPLWESPGPAQKAAMLSTLMAAEEGWGSGSFRTSTRSRPCITLSPMHMKAAALQHHSGAILPLPTADE